MTYITRDTQTGTPIDTFSSLVDAKQAITRYEARDLRDDAYEAGFYEIAQLVDGEYITL